MERKKFEVSINATPERVWHILWTDETYRKWTAVFHEGSRAISDWKVGSKVLFVDGDGNGMVSRIAEMDENRYMSFEHLGEVKGGVEDTQSEKVKKWAGAHENYTLTLQNGGTHLVTDIDLDGEFMQMFEDIFPKALAIVKELSEA
ncbi:MAG: SRPBCC domain-containing protein [Taibaiella sp.]|nr:SRPBCC domain-containing protein [Taibaiella sp.]